MPERKDILQRFGGLLKAARMRKKLTLVDAEVLTGIDNGNLSRIENGEKNIEITTLLHLLKCYELEPGELITPDLIALAK